MITDNVIGARDVGKTFAEAVREDPDAVTVWAGRHRDVFEIWLLTRAIDAEHERALYARVAAVHDAFPNALTRVYLLNPASVEDVDEETLVAENVPDYAEEIFSRRE
ncbi:MAG: hypothetical protein EA415_11100 [Sphaerobacteraceae bacterium]|nr:MAG: hypothetical protein EA415_11100 [Sphaerobacteraceae bacterium]